MAEVSTGPLPKWAESFTGSVCGCGAALVRVECFCGGHGDICSRSGFASDVCSVVARIARGVETPHA